jgi:hypothetical protein
MISKQTKKKLYMTLIRPIVTYGCETWTLSVQVVNSFLVYEINSLRIYGAVQTEE